MHLQSLKIIILWEPYTSFIVERITAAAVAVKAVRSEERLHLGSTVDNDAN